MAVLDYSRNQRVYIEGIVASNEASAECFNQDGAEKEITKVLREKHTRRQGDILTYGNNTDGSADYRIGVIQRIYWIDNSMGDSSVGSPGDGRVIMAHTDTSVET